jgi:hypothetical protein
MAGVGMSVPGATDLGLGSTLTGQVAGETDEERRKRMLMQQQQKLLPGTSQGAAPGTASSLMTTGYGAATPPGI